MSRSTSEQNLENPYYPAFDLLLAKLLAADLALAVSEAVFGYATESPEEWLKRILDGRACSMLADICDGPGFVKHIPSLREPDKESDFLLRAVRDLRMQSCSWAIARAFEAFREFVGAIEKELPNTSDTEASQGLKTSAEDPKDKPPSFDAALKNVRRAAPLLRTCEERNARGIHLPQWIRLVAAVRHAVAHNDGVLSDVHYKKYRDSGLESHFPGDLETDTGYVLKPTPEVVQKTIRTLREYGVAIYKFVSEARDLPARLVGQNGEITTWRK